VACVDASREPKESSKENENGKKQEEKLKNLEEKSSPYRVYEIGVQSDKDISDEKLGNMKNKNVSFLIDELILLMKNSKFSFALLIHV
jgi:hypothetical protein